MSGLVVVGSLNLDRTLKVTRLPGPGETVVATESALVGCGGKGANQARAAAVLGAVVHMVGCVGDDAPGELLRVDLAHNDVDVSHVRLVASASSGSATIALDGSGNNLIVVDPGANALLMDFDVDNSLVWDAPTVLVQLEIPLEVAALTAKVASGRVVLNPAPAPPGGLSPELVSNIDVLVPNRGELGILAGTVPPRDVASVARLIDSLATPFSVVVTLGALGALVARPVGKGRRFSHVPAPTVEVLDTTGAGDVFCAALSVALGEANDLEEATRFAVAAAALSTTGYGARGALPDRYEVEAMVPELQIAELYV